MLNFRAQGAKSRVRRKENSAIHPIATFATSSVILRLKKAEIDAMPRVIKEITSIFLCYLIILGFVERSFGYKVLTYFRPLTVFPQNCVEMNSHTGTIFVSYTIFNMDVNPLVKIYEHFYHFLNNSHG
jgi:hypothetical protein